MTQTKEINWIFHISDLHIRNLQRHNEYRSVFNKFLNEVKNSGLEDSIIVIAGDIAHAKTDMTPELVREISWFLNECSILRETVIITGNHDCNLNNQNRLDVLTPIVEYINSPRIHYLRDTGVYNLYNLTFVTYSILDKKENWPIGTHIKGDNKICLFHGPVNKSNTDMGYQITSNHFTVDMFNGFDMVLLGDIHKRQNLQKYHITSKIVNNNEIEYYLNNGWTVKNLVDFDNTEIECVKPEIAYPSSLIQQNHSELLDNHGYLLWNVNKRNYTEHNIFNECGFITIDIQNGIIPTWVYDELDTKLPKYPRIRLRFEDTEISRIKECVSELKSLFNVEEITVTRTDTVGKLKTGDKLNKNIVGDVRDIGFQNSLIREHLERQFLLEDDTLNELVKLNEKLNGLVDTRGLSDNILWTPKNFEFSNMFSYGENNKINFDKAKGIVGLFAGNANGKSSLIESLVFCIYDKTTRTHLAKNILNNRRDNFYCKFNFEIDGINYFIERIAKIKKSRDSVKVDVNFWREIHGNIESLNGEQRRDTNKNIEKYLGKFDDFILTTLSIQGNNAILIDKSQTERKEILSQFIGVDIFDKLYDIANVENNNNATLIKRFKNDDFTTQLDTIKSKLEVDKNEFNLLQINLDVLKLEINKLNDELMELNKKLIPLTITNTNLDELNIRKSNLESAIKTYDENIILIKTKISKLDDLELELTELLNSLNEDELKLKVDELNKLNKYKDSLKHKPDKLRSILSVLEKQLENLKSHKYNEDCNVCISNFQKIHSEKLQTIETIENTNIELSKTESELSIIEKTIESLLPYNEKYETYLNVFNKLNKVNSTRIALLNELKSEELKIEKSKNEIDRIQSDIKIIIDNELTIKNNKIINDNIVKVKSDLKCKQTELDKITSKILSTNGIISSLEKQRDLILDKIDEIRKLEDESKLYEYYLSAVSKDGISYELIEKSLPLIESEVNNILSQIVEFTVQLDMEGKNINAYINYENQRWSLEMSSGMERFISGLAIRVALINVCNLPRPNFLVIDEGFGVLDSENIQSIYMLFTYLKTQFDFVLIISHIDSMRDVVDELIDIKKENGFSRVKY